MPDFVHLHTHSHFSLLDGAGKIDALLDKAKEYGMTSLALTDHGAMYGIIEFYEKANKKGLKPILGVETYIAPRKMDQKEPRLDSKPHHLILLAENYEGYLNLIKIVSAAHLDGFYYKPRVDKDFLRNHSAGIIALTACLKGEIPSRAMVSPEEGSRAIEEYLQIFDQDHLFLELQHHPNSPDQTVANQALIKLAKKHGLGLVATNDIHYINKDDAEAQDVLMCVSSGKTVNEPNRMNLLDFDLSFLSGEQMAEYFKDTPEALENTAKIAERCEVKIPMGTNILPVFPLPEGTTDRQYLRKLCGEGMKARYGVNYTCREDRPENKLLPSPLNDPAVPIEERATLRLEYELSVIEKMGFESYFLIVQDFINWGRSQKILIGLRGSAAGSLVSFLIGISDVDPLKHNLIFERFLNPERISMPDIDTDIEDSRRDEVIQYVRDRYGSDHVAQIITFGTMAARNAVRDVGRALGVSYNECDYIAKLIPAGPGGMTLKEAVENIPELKTLYEQNENTTKLIDIASKLEGISRHTSIHAAGVVISKEPLTSYVPLQSSAKDETAIVTQYAMSEIEHIGLLKMDFLGLANLSIIQQAIRVIRKTRQKEIDLKTIPIDDKPTYDLLSRAETTGVFQLESAGMKRYLKELKPTQFEDIASMVALYRPGPMDAIPDFIESKHGRRAITYLHPILKPILETTYGVIVTQDQVLEVARKFANFTYGEADVLRKAVGKKIKALLDEQREKFIKGAQKNPEISQEIAEKVWDFVEPFARYGFNRAHAISYAMIAYQTAYLKAHYPMEFMSALLTSDINNLDRLGIEIAECRDRGIEVLPPSVNESFVEFGTIFYSGGSPKHKYDSYIRFGLGAIKNVGLQPAEAIVEERKSSGPYKDLADFLKRGSHFLNKKVLENLAMSGALDCLAERQAVLHNMETILRFISQIRNQKASTQIGLFDMTEEEVAGYSLSLLSCEPADPKTRLKWERELLGIYLSDHPISSYLDYLPEDRTPIVALKELDNNAPVRVCGIVMTAKKILTKKNETMAFVGLEDETGQTEIILFPRAWSEKEKTIMPGEALVVDGKVSRKDRRRDRGNSGEQEENEGTEEIKILLDTCQALSLNKTARKKNPTRVVLSIPDSGNRELLQVIKAHLEKNPGEIPVTLMLPSLEGQQAMQINQKIQPSERLYSQLAYLIGPDRVVFE